MEYVQPSLFDARLPRITRGLVIREPWADRILSGHKVWEIRGARTHVRGRIAIIAGGTGQISGVATLIAVHGPLTEHEYQHAYIQRGDTTHEPHPLPYPKTFAWVLSSAHRLSQPIPYAHPNGAVIWVKLSPSIQDRLQEELDR